MAVCLVGCPDVLAKGVFIHLRNFRGARQVYTRSLDGQSLKLHEFLTVSIHLDPFRLYVLVSSRETGPHTVYKKSLEVCLNYLESEVTPYILHRRAASSPGDASGSLLPSLLSLLPMIRTFGALFLAP